MPLTAVKLQALRAAPRSGKHADKDGLFLRVDAKYRMYWQWRVRYAGKENTISYGPFPEVSLAEARERHRVARLAHRDGVNTNTAKREAKMARIDAATSSFEVVAREWHSNRKSEWADSTQQKVLRRMELDIFPRIGRVPIADIDPPAVLAALRKVEERGAIETAHRALENCGQIFKYAVAAGYIKSDPSRDLKGALRKPASKHMAAITDLKELGGLLRAIDGYAGTHVVRTALALLPLLMVRPGELRMAQWEEIDLNKATWIIPAARMKRSRDGKLNGQPHFVGLPSQAVSLLQQLSVLTGPTGNVFPGEANHDRPISENTLNAALRRMGYDTQKEHTAHGFRATARTLIAEQLGIEAHLIEAQLAHEVADSLGRAYNRTQFLEARRTMLQQWADYLDLLKAPQKE